MPTVDLGLVVGSNGQGVPTGGSAGQILAKNSSSNYDTGWVPMSAAAAAAFGIVENGNAASQTIAAGQYVIWKGVLYTADAAIASGTTLAASGGNKNLTAVSNGGLNALNSNISSLIGSTKWTDWTTVTQYTSGESWNGSYYTKIGKITYVRISAKNFTQNTLVELFTLPNDYRPLFSTIEFVGVGGSAYLKFCQFRITDVGKVYVYIDDTYASGFISFPSI